MRSGASQETNRRRYIGINAHLLASEPGYRRAGIHHYIDQLLAHLPQTDAGLYYYVYTQQESGWPADSDLTIVPSRWPTARRSVRILWEQSAWPYLARRHALDLMHSMAFVTPPFAVCPVIVTIYDLSFIHFPDSFPPNQRRYLQAQARRSARLAHRLIAISEAGRQDIHQIYGVPLERIDVVRPGVDPRYRPLAPEAMARFRHEHALPERFILHVGTLQPRKNIPVLLKALSRVKDPDLQLVLIGGRGWLTEEIDAEIRALGLHQRVHLPGYVADGALPGWYNAAEAVIVPSLYEGFGLPVVEALACGTPVIAANSSSLPEAGGEAALYFDPHDPDALASQIERLLQDRPLAEQLAVLGPQRASQFSWTQAGNDQTAAYLRALNLPLPVR